MARFEEPDKKSGPIHNNDIILIKKIQQMQVKQSRGLAISPVQKDLSLDFQMCSIKNKIYNQRS